MQRLFSDRLSPNQLGVRRSDEQRWLRKKESGLEPEACRRSQGGWGVDWEAALFGRDQRIGTKADKPGARSRPEL